MASEMQRLRLRDPAADRRRHDVPRPHRGQGRPEVRRPRRVGQGRVRARCRPRRRCCSDAQRDQLLADVKADYDALRTRHAAKSDRPQADLRGGPGERARPSTGTATSRRPPGSPACTCSTTTTSRELRDYIDWQPFFNAWEMKGKFPDILNSPTMGRGGAQALRRRAGDARPDHRGEVDHRHAASSASSRPPAAATTRRLRRRDRDPRCGATLHHLRQQGEHRDGVPNRSLADFVAPVETGLADHVGGFAVTAGDRPAEAGPGVQGRPRRLQRDPASSRSPTGSPRRSPSGSTSGCAPSSGATRPTSR